MSDPQVLWTAPIVNGSGVSKGQNCSVELLGLAIYGDYRYGFRLPCIDAGAQHATVRVNDLTSEGVKQTRRWRLLLARLGTCHNTGNDRVARRMALWAARSVEHLSDDPRVKACNDVLERWLAGEATDEELRDADADAYADADADASAAAADASAASAAAYDAASAAAYADAYADASAAYAAAAASAAAADRDDALLDWLDRYLDAWQKVAADEGCLLPEDMEAEYVAFVEQLDFLTAAIEGETP